MAKKKRIITLFDGDEELKLRFTTNAMVAYEELMGAEFTSVMEHFRNATGGRIAFKVMRAILWAGLVEHQPDIKVSDAGGILDRVGLTEAMAKVSEAVQSAFPDAGDEDAPGNVEAADPE